MVVDEVEEDGGSLGVEFDEFAEGEEFCCDNFGI